MDINVIKKNLQKKWKKIFIEKENLRKQALKEIKKFNNVFKKHHEIDSIYIFGSINNAGKFNKNSDIDLGIVGNINDVYFIIWRELENLTKFKVDLRDINKNNNFSKSIRKKGKLLYVKK